MAYLSMKLDHFAVLRQARRGKNPLPAQTATLAELAGVDGITIHMRNDRRHIREKDLFVLKETVSTRLTVEIMPTEENLSRVLEAKPYMVTFIPEVDREITTQSGLALPEVEFDLIGEMAYRLQELGIKTALHIEPDTDVIKKASKMGVDAVKLHTGFYAGARTEEEGLAELEKISRAAGAASKANLVVMAGQGLDYQNLTPLARMGVIDEFVIGQAIVARAALVGIERAVKDLIDVLGRETAGAHA
jgi:pyridoxine 5-phosphate synthase